MAPETQSQKTTSLKKQSLGMLVALALQYLFGMYIAMFALPPEDPGFATESMLPKLIFGLHGLLGTALLVGALLALRSGLASTDSAIRKMSWHACISIFVAFFAGIATITLGDEASEIASFVMSVGFLLSFFFYGKIVYVLKKD